MGIYRKKPVEIEAIQFTGDHLSINRLTLWSNKQVWPNTSGFGEFLGTLSINTLEGIMTASKGDYIIKGVKGEFYPCKPDIFELTYEMVEKTNENPNYKLWEETGLLDNINSESSKINIAELMESEASKLIPKPKTTKKNG